MIYTLTLNPSLDYSLEYDEKIKAYQSTQFFSFIPGGKGINASILLSNLKIKNKALIPIGGNVGAILEEIIRDKINFIKIPTENRTRVNVEAHFLNEKYEMNVSNQKIDSSKLVTSVIKELAKILKTNDLVMIMGSLPTGMDIDGLSLIIDQVIARKAKVVIDLPQGHLINALKYKPEIVKTNIFELRDIFEFTIETEEDIKRAINEILTLGAKRIIVSNGKKSAYYMDSENFVELKPIKIDKLNSSGAGDSMISGFISQFINGKRLEECLKFAVSAGGSTTATNGIASKLAIQNNLKNVELIWK